MPTGQKMLLEDIRFAHCYATSYCGNDFWKNYAPNSITYVEKWLI